MEEDGEQYGEVAMVVFQGEPLPLAADFEKRVAGWRRNPARSHLWDTDLVLEMAREDPLMEKLEFLQLVRPAQN